MKLYIFAICQAQNYVKSIQQYQYLCKFIDIYAKQSKPMQNIGFIFLVLKK